MLPPEHPAIGLHWPRRSSARPETTSPLRHHRRRYDLRNDGGRLYRSVPAYLGPQHAPLAVTDPARGLENLGQTSPDLEARPGDAHGQRTPFRPRGVPAAGGRGPAGGLPPGRQPDAVAPAPAPSTWRMSPPPCGSLRPAPLWAVVPAGPPARRGGARRSWRSSTAAGTTTRRRPQHDPAGPVARPPRNVHPDP